LDAKQKLLSKVEYSKGHWLWTGALNNDGYPPHGEHRKSYELFIGPIPEGSDLDHTHRCPRHCINPDHLKPATRSQNLHFGYNRRRGQMSPNNLRMARLVHESVTKRLNAPVSPSL
jgi:hypothetical protein